MTLDDRVAALEKRIRLWRALTIGLLILGVSWMVWASNRVRNLANEWNEAMPPIAKASRHIGVIDDNSRIRAVWYGSGDGWTIKSYAASASESQTRPPAYTLDYVIVDGSPRLSMTDHDGREVWHAP